MSTTVSTMASASPAGVGRRSSRRISPSSLTSAPAILVPPISIPIACTRVNPTEMVALSGTSRLPSDSLAANDIRVKLKKHPSGFEGDTVQQIDTPAVVAASPEANVTDLLVDRVKLSPDVPLFALPQADGGWQDVTASEFYDQVRALAKGLVAAGIQPGDKIGLICRTRYEWTLLDFAVWFAGAILVPVYDTSVAAPDPVGPRGLRRDRHRHGDRRALHPVRRGPRPTSRSSQRPGTSTSATSTSSRRPARRSRTRRSSAGAISPRAPTSRPSSTRRARPETPRAAFSPTPTSTSSPAMRRRRCPRS